MFKGCRRAPVLPHPLRTMTLPVRPPQPSITRRQFIGVAGSAGGAALMAGGLGIGGAQLAVWLAPVVSFHADAPYVDHTGLARPFHPRIATVWADGLDEEAVLRLGHHF